MKTRTTRAAALHRQAAATAAAVRDALAEAQPPAIDEREQRELADLLSTAASALAPGWLGAPLESGSTYASADRDRPLRHVRIGTAEPLAGVRFPAVVPLLGTGHLAFDVDARDARVAALLRALLFRLLAAAPAGSLLVRGVTGSGAEKVFTPFAPLADAGLLPPPATDRAGLLAVLAEAERWVRPGRPTVSRDRRRERSLLVVVARMPDSTEPADLARLLALAPDGADAGLHLVVAGWPARLTPGAGEVDRPEQIRQLGGEADQGERTNRTGREALVPFPLPRTAPARTREGQRGETAATGSWQGRVATPPRGGVGTPATAPVLAPARSSYPPAQAGQTGQAGQPTQPGRASRRGQPTQAGRSDQPTRSSQADQQDQSTQPGQAAGAPFNAPSVHPGGSALGADGSDADPVGRFRPAPPTGPVARSRYAPESLAAASAGPGVPPLACSTTILVRDTHARLGDPPGASFGGRGPRPFSTGLNAPVLLDPEPPAELINRVCRDLAQRFAVGCRPRLADLLPDPREYWTEDAGVGLTTVVGHDGETPVTLRFAELTPHWLIAGRSGAGSSAFLTNVLHGLCARYRPESLVVHLLSVRPGPAFAEFLPSDRNPSWLPHVRTAGVAADREYALTLLRELDAELDRRTVVFERAGVGRLAGLPEPDRPPRILCVVDGAPALFAPADRMARETLRLVESVARRGRTHGVHLVFLGRPTESAGGAYPDQLLGQFPVRVALPGGGDVLEPTNDAAAGLPMGTAVVNTAGGLGGPRGATRGHERTVRFPDPAADAPERDELRNRLWLARPSTGRPPPADQPPFANQPAPPDEPASPDQPAPWDGPASPDEPAPWDAPASPDEPAPWDGPASPDEPVPPARPPAFDGPRVYDGSAPAVLDADPTYRAMLAAGTGRVVALLGRPVDATRATAAFALDDAPGRHLAVVGRSPAGAEVLAAAARGVAAACPAGTARFVVAPLVPESAAPAESLATALRARHEVAVVDVTGLAEALTGDRPGYLVVFGMDAATPTDLPPEVTRSGLRTGPSRGVHLLSWWRRTRRLVELAGDGALTEYVAGMLLLDLPPIEAEYLLGREADWKPRPHRATLVDHATGEVRLIVPFCGSAG